MNVFLGCQCLAQDCPVCHVQHSYARVIAATLNAKDQPCSAVVCRASIVATSVSGKPPCL